MALTIIARPKIATEPMINPNTAIAIDFFLFSVVAVVYEPIR